MVNQSIVSRFDSVFENCFLVENPTVELLVFLHQTLLNLLDVAGSFVGVRKVRNVGMIDCSGRVDWTGSVGFFDGKVGRLVEGG